MRRGLLLSGGMDSAALCWWKKPEICFFVDYGQIPSQGERRASENIANRIGSSFVEIKVDCSKLGSGMLAGLDSLKQSPSVEWWPFRNQLLLTLVASQAVMKNIDILYFGSVSTDSFHQDGTAKFFELLNDLMEFQEGNLKVEAPAIELRSEELIDRSKVPNEIIQLAHSCHRSQFACGTCGGCVKHFAILRMKGIVY